MKLLFKQFIAFIIMASIVFCPSASWAGDVIKAGTTLEEDSYVFTIEEATNLLQRIEELEVKEKELNKYKELEILRVQQVDLYKINLDYSQSQIDRYISLNQMNQDLIDRYHSRDRLQTWENIGFLSLGVAITVAAFMGADAITDDMEAH